MTDESYDKFIGTLMKRKHMSPLEFADMTVEMVVGRDVMAEITRHRHASFAIQSQRYVRDNKSGDICFIRPDFWVPQEEKLDVRRWCASRKWEESRRMDEDEYRYYLDECSLTPQDARVGLPNSVATVIVMKANLREWLHIMDLRSGGGAYPKMQEVMKLLLQQAAHLYPTVFGKEKDE